MADEQQASLAPILLVEDEPNDVWLMRRAFERARVSNPLIVAGSGDEAMERLAACRDGSMPCLLITDIKMPRVDGFELLCWLETQPQLRDLPRVVISSSVLEEDLARSLQLGATAYYVKPSRQMDLMELVLQWKEMFGLNTTACVYE